VPPPQKILGLFHLKWLVLVQIPLYILTEMLGYLLLGPRQQYRGPILLATDGVLLLGRALGMGCEPSSENFGTF